MNKMLSRWMYLFALLSMAWGQELSIITQPATINVVSKNQSVTLTFAAENEGGVSYQWYQSVDGSIATGEKIEGATEESYTTEVFAEKEIRYYYCVATTSDESVISNIATAVYTGLPILYVNTPEGVEITSKEIWTENATLTLTDADDPSWNFKDITTSIRGRGNTTWSLKKKPYAIKLDKKREIMGMPKHKRWVLIANYLDNSFLKNHLAFYFSEKFGMDYTVRGKFVNLVFNGVYRGLYWLGEAIQVDENRVNIYDGDKKIKDDEDKDYLIEMDDHYDEPAKFKSATRQLPYMIKNDDYMVDDDGNMTSGGDARLLRLQKKVDALEKILYPDFKEDMNTNDCSAPDESYSQIIDVASWAKFWFVNAILDNAEVSRPRSAYFTFDSKNNVFKAGPVWDFDWAALSKRDHIRIAYAIYYNALQKSPYYVAVAEQLWKDLSPKINFINEIETMREYLRIPAKVDSIRWGVHLDPSNVERENYDAYVDFFEDVLTNNFNLVDEYITQTLPQYKLLPSTIALSAETFTYDGVEKTPEVVISNGEDILAENTDYNVVFLNNTNTGIATATITGMGEYAGSVQKTFEIIPNVTSYAAIQIIEDEKGRRAVINGNYGETDAVELTGDITVASVEFSRVFSTNESATSTLMLPFDVSTGNLTGVQMVLEFDSVAVCRDQSGNPLTNGVGVCVSALWDANQAQTSAILKANTPYMVMMNNATLGITGGVTLQETNPVVVKDKLDPEGWRFQGTYVYKVWNYDTEEKPGQIRGYAAMEQDGAKIGQYVKFGPGASLKPFRAYLYNPNETPLTPPKNAPKASDGAKLAPIANTVASVEDDAMDVVIVGRDNNGEEHTTVIGRYIPRTGEVRLNGEAKRTFDLKGRRANESVKGMYLRK